MNDIRPTHISVSERFDVCISPWEYSIAIASNLKGSQHGPYSDLPLS